MQYWLHAETVDCRAVNDRLARCMQPVSAGHADGLLTFFTPRHGRWVDMADVEIGLVPRGYLSRRMDCLATMRRRLTTWERTRHRERRTMSWPCPSRDARHTRHRLSPDRNNNVD